MAPCLSSGRPRRPKSQGLSPAALAEVLRAGVPGLRSLLVARNGVLVGESYYAGASATDLLAINSVTKSVSSMLVGLALPKGATCARATCSSSPC